MKMKASEIWSVSQVNKYMKQRLERDEQLSDLWIRGEISNFTHHSSGHMYFTLKDKDSRIKAIMFQSYNRFLKFVPKDGTKAIVRGSISVFERDGAYQLYAREMQPDGLGSLYLAFEQLKEKLSREGLFAPERKRQLPLFPRKIGIVTSPTGAALRDMCTTIKRRLPQTAIVVIPALVQGVEAPASIIRAIQQANRQADLDVLIVGRGGGSIEELWAFNDEYVARAISASAIPIISAVGHETDFTIADFVADVRAATPTAAAELAVPHYMEYLGKVRQTEERLHRAMHVHLQTERKRLAQLQNSYALRKPQRRLDESRQRIEDARLRLESTLALKVRRERERINYLQQLVKRTRLPEQLGQRQSDLRSTLKKLDQLMEKKVTEARYTWNHALAQLDALSPLKIMQRGYSLVYQDGKLMKSVDDIATGDKLVIRLKDGTVGTEVREIIREGTEDGS